MDYYYIFVELRQTKNEAYLSDVEIFEADEKKEK